MVDTITYRTTDGTRWGGGLGVDLSAAQIDINFWVLESQLAAIQDHISSVADIDYFNVVGKLMYVHLTNHVVLGPYTLPTAVWSFRDAWTPITGYDSYDIITNANATYIVLWPHTSAATFDPYATDGGGHSLYGLLIAAGTNLVSSGGTRGQRLVKISGDDFDYSWASDFRNLALFVAGPSLASELLLRYVATDILVFPIGLTGSLGSCETVPTSDTIFDLEKNGNPIGSITFAAGSGAASFIFTGVEQFDQGDILTIIAPSHPDDTAADFSVTLQAALAS